MSVYICSDLHLDHRNIGKFRHFVGNSEENTILIQEDWNRRISKNDLVYCLGDAAFSKEGLDILGNLKGRKILIKGNHCDFVSTKDQMEVFEEVHGMLKYKGMWLTHCPIHPDELRGKNNVHGHTHNHIIHKGWGPWKKVDQRYLNCCVDVIYPKYNSIFISLDQVRQYFSI